MEPNGINQGIEFIARVLEILSVAVIAISFSHGMIISLQNFVTKKLDAFANLKIRIGQALQLALEFLIAADIIRTVIIKPTREGIVLLGLLIVVRTFLSWSITVEIEGCWPWQVAKNRKG